jgi:hypothetical protein
MPRKLVNAPALTRIRQTDRQIDRQSVSSRSVSRKIAWSYSFPPHRAEDHTVQIGPDRPTEDRLVGPPTHPSWNHPRRNFRPQCTLSQACSHRTTA